jgi:2-polyprenyl-3-methyl-5-hydroxy-6-metoxy-1,4-benzoquinol methylase
MLTCILCDSSKIARLEVLNNDDIALLYAKRAGIDVRHFFDQKHTALYSCNDCNLIFFSPIVVGNSSFYDQLQSYNDYYLKDKAEYTEAAKFITSEMNILEIGCGEGAFMSYINAKSYTGLEYSDKAIEFARNRNLNIIKESVEEHSASYYQNYDAVCCFQVLEHVPDPKSFITASVNCLKPDGLFIIAVPAQDSFIKEAVNFYLNMPPHHVSKWTDSAFRFLPKKFQVKLEMIYHEPLNKVHVLFYLKTKINYGLRRFLGIKFSSIDKKRISKLIYVLSVGISFIFKPFWSPKKIVGQSVLIIYRKTIKSL